MPLVSKSFSDIITFTRASSGTYFDATGTLQTATTNNARFDYDPSTLAARGMLVEEQRTNLLLRSEDFGNASWTKNALTVTTNATTAKDGTVSADLIIPSAVSTDHLVSQSVGSVSSGATYTLSVFAKAEGYSWARLSFGSVAGGGYAFFDLGTGALGATSGVTASIQNVGNGWYRCVITRTTTTLGDLAGDIYVNSSNSQFGFAGNGTSGIYVWGAQLEAGAFATSYIATTAASATRAADVASVNTLSPWYNASAGTLYVDAALSRQNTLANNKIANLIGSGSTEIKIFLRGSGATGMSVIDSGGATLADFTGAVIAANGTNKTALAYALNDFAGTTNGASVSTDTSGTPPTATSLDIGNSGILCGWVRRITYYPRRLSNAELQGITT